jgi:hypothetical protein
MDEFLATVYMVLGILLRIGIPFAITFLLAYLLRNLDTKWRAEALEAQPGDAVMRELWLNEPCWEGKDCIEEQREICPAYSQREQPCWEVHRDNGNLNPKCQTCEYRKELLIPVRIMAESSK